MGRAGQEVSCLTKPDQRFGSPSLEVNHQAKKPIRKPCSVGTRRRASLPSKTIKHMKRVQAKIEENRKENPISEPDRRPDTWLIEAKLDEHIIDWENKRLEFRLDEIEAEIVESSMSEPNRFTLRTHGESPLTKGDVIHVDIREQNES